MDRGGQWRDCVRQRRRGWEGGREGGRRARRVNGKSYEFLLASYVCRLDLHLGLESIACVVTVRRLFYGGKKRIFKKYLR